MNRMPITTTSIAHVRLTVTDIARSRQFYDSVFGWPVFLEMPEDADDATRAQLWFLFGGVVYNIGDALLGPASGRDRQLRRRPRRPGPHCIPGGEQGRIRCRRSTSR